MAVLSSFKWHVWPTSSHWAKFQVSVSSPYVLFDMGRNCRFLSLLKGDVRSAHPECNKVMEPPWRIRNKGTSVRPAAQLGIALEPP